MLLQKGGGFMGLPSRYRAGNRYFQHGTFEKEASDLPRKDEGSSRRSCHFSQSLSAAESQGSDKNRVLSPKVSFPSKLVVNGTSGSPELNSSRTPMRGSSRTFLHSRHPQTANSMSMQFDICSKDDGEDGTADTEQHPSSDVRRSHSLSHLPNCNKREYSPMQTLARRTWSGPEPDLKASLHEESQRGSEVEGMALEPGRQSQLLRERNLVGELNMMQFELFSLKQKQMENSFAHLEKEKKWLETNFLENRKQEGDLDDKIFSVEMELAKVKSYIGRRNHKSSQPVALDADQNGAAEKRDNSQELVALHKSLAAHKKHIKTLERKGSEMEQELKSAKEGQQMAFSQLSEAEQRATDSLQASQALREQRDKLQVAYNSVCLEKDRLEEKVTELNLELKPALSDRKRLLEEKVALHQQVQRLTLELECAQKQQEGFSAQVSALHSELASAKSQVSHQDKEKVLMKEELEYTRQAKEVLSSEVAESHQRLEDSLEKLHHLEAEKKILDNRIQALENERFWLLGEREGIPLQNRTDAWKNQEDDMKALRESCENLRESQTLLQREKDLLQVRCLELEAALHGKQEMSIQLAEQQEISQYWKDRWEEVAVALKTQEEEVEDPCMQSLSAKAESPMLLQVQLDACKQELELERNRSQALQHQVQQLQSGSQSQAVPPHKCTDFSSEKQRLERLVTSLEEQLAEKEQALRELKDAKDMDKPQVEFKGSSSDPKGCHHHHHQGLDAKVIRSSQQDQESLKLQHQLVTEQLKGIFREREKQKQGSWKHLVRLQEESSAMSPKPQGTLTITESMQFPEGGAPKPFESCSGGEVESLRQQLRQNAEIISSMASEIQALKQKNESLMKAKLRFQQQIEEICNVSKQQPEKSTIDLLVPKLTGKILRLDLQSAEGSDNSLTSPQSDAPTSSSNSRENLLVVQQPSHDSVGHEQSHLPVVSNAGHSSPLHSACHGSPISAVPLQLHPDISDASVPSIRLSLEAAIPSLQDAQSPAESDGALLSPRSPALLSPRPFGLPRPRSPFRFRGTPESSDS
ncbi:centromere-associated protein E-like [Sceloporus undulatus]|uniref:centromere-associated protein E-like n=1 Tax=Sceloporus undulatus TaxID=8520 RepID=UPI001C4BB1D8|nr:centromere-associated protein E-like [Sceloporus undulatus]